MGSTGVMHDAVLLAVLLGVVAMIALAVHLTGQVRALVSSRPPLPSDDWPPAGLGRLVPVGAQIEQECRRGVVTMELWLTARRRN